MKIKIDMLHIFSGRELNLLAMNAGAFDIVNLQRELFRLVARRDDLHAQNRPRLVKLRLDGEGPRFRAPRIVKCAVLVHPRDFVGKNGLSG